MISDHQSIRKAIENFVKTSWSSRSVIKFENTKTSVEDQIKWLRCTLQHVTRSGEVLGRGTAGESETFYLILGFFSRRGTGPAYVDSDYDFMLSKINTQRESGPPLATDEGDTIHFGIPQRGSNQEEADWFSTNMYLTVTVY